MANLGLSAKQEKADRLQKTKQEISEMVKQRLEYMKSKVCCLLSDLILLPVVWSALILVDYNDLPPF